MKKYQSGFTLIELVMVIVLASASAVNYASTQVGKGTTGITTCAGMAVLLQGGALPSSKVGITAVTTTLTVGGYGECGLTNSDGGAAAVWAAVAS